MNNCEKTLRLSKIVKKYLRELNNLYAGQEPIVQLLGVNRIAHVFRIVNSKCLRNKHNEFKKF